MKFSPDLTARVRTALNRAGYCFLSSDEIQRLLAVIPRGRYAQYEALQEFAEICGAEVETTTHLTSARFVPASASRDTTPHPVETPFRSALEA